MMQISISAVVLNALESAGVPGILDVRMLPASCNTNCVVQIHKSYEGQAKQVAAAIWGSSIPNWQCR
ncbi:MAG: UbiD family decarboxylase [Thermodesulfobacteriota bacterium]|nr:UbiD family decarboxylase [Thermodesulfobacteriota bacterium]